MALTKIDDRGLKTPIDLLDNEKIRFGTGNDLEIYHVGTDGNYSYITDSSGRVYLKSNRFYGQAADGVNQIYWEADGATNLYYDGSLKLGTYSNGINVSGRIQFTDVGLTDVIEVPDSKKITVGSGGDMSFYHNGSNGWNYIQSLANNIAIQAKTGENSVTCYADDKVELYFDHSKKFETRSGGIGVFGHYEAGDNNKIMLGDSNDLQIYHDGSNSYIDDAGTGNLYLRGSASIELRKAGGVEKMLYAEPDAAVELYYDNVKKFETETTGAKVTGLLGVNVTPDTSASSTYPLQIKGSSQCYLSIANDTTGTGIYNGLIIGNDPTDVYIYNRENTPISFGVNGVTKFIMKTGGQFQIIDGDLQLASGHGIDFSATSDATGKTSELLDDYEEGTWTPATVGPVTGVSYTNRYGRYTKVGNLVHFWFDMTWTSLTVSGNNASEISGLPFASTATTAQAGYGAPQFRSMTGINTDARTGPNSSYIAASSILLYHFNSSGNETKTEFLGSGRLTGQGFYYTNNVY